MLFQRIDWKFHGPLEFVGDGFDGARLERIAANGGDGSLGRAVEALARRPRNVMAAQPDRLVVVFGPAQGERTVERTWGWPFVVMEKRLNTGFEDALRGVGPFLSASYSAPPEMLGRWQWWSRVTAHRFETVGTTWDWRRIDVLSVFANLAAAAALWRLMWWFCGLVLRRNRRSWLGWRLNGALAVVATSVVVAGSFWFGATHVERVTARALGTRAVEGLTRARARELCRTGAGDAEIARLILQHRGDETGFLAAAFAEAVPVSFGQANYGWPFLVVQVYTHEDAGPDGKASGRFAAVPLVMKTEELRVVAGHWAGARQRALITLYGGVFAWVGAVWLMGWAAARMVWIWVRWRARRRERRGLCVACGYPTAR
jgi:hypothetical protein